MKVKTDIELTNDTSKKPIEKVDIKENSSLLNLFIPTLSWN